MPVSSTTHRSKNFPSCRVNDETHPRHRIMDETRDQPQLGVVPRLPQNTRSSIGAVPIPATLQPVDEAACNELRGLLPHVVELATDREGTRRVQQLLDMVSPTERGLVQQEVMPMALGLMQHSFGHHLVVRLLHYGNEAQRAALTTLVAENIIELSCGMFGCRVVQKVLELHTKVPSQINLAGLLQGYVVPLAADQNGNHVLQCWLEMLPEASSFVFEELRGHIAETSCLKFGCRVVQRLLSTLAENTVQCYEMLVAVIDEVVHNLHHLVTDQFGNYVVQAVMSCNQPCGLKPVYLLRGSYPILCRHKHASNVVETAFCVAPPSLRNALVDELCPHIVQLSGDPFGNFVVQRLYELSDVPQQATLAAAIRGGAVSLKMNLHGRSVLGMLQRLESNTPTAPATGAAPPAPPASQAPAAPSAPAAGAPSNTPAGQLPFTMYMRQGPLPLSASMSSVCTTAPNTPLTPSTAVSFTSSGEGWTHNPNYGASPFVAAVPQQAPPTPQQQKSDVAPEECGSPDNDLSEAYAYGY